MKKESKSKRVYFVPTTSLLIAQYQNVAQLFEDKNFKQLTVTVNPEQVSDMDTEMVHEMILALQHYPHILEKLVFALDFEFPQIPDSELYFQEADWKNDKANQRWFASIGESLLALFFMRDQDVRLYTLAGDLVADGKCSFKHQEGEKYAFIGFKDEALETLCLRLHSTCYMFHLYCHGSGFNPQPAIEAVLAEFNLPISYKDIRNRYLKSVRTGIYVRIQAEGEDGEKRVLK